MNVGTEVETSCEYGKMFRGKSFKGIIRKVSDRDENVVEVEMLCGCMTWINKQWLKKKHCGCCHCSCCCAH